MFHLECIYRTNTTLFEIKKEIDWKCDDCFKCAKCGSKKLIDSNIKFANIKLEFTDNCNFCYKCGLFEAFYKYCRICGKFCT